MNKQQVKNAINNVRRALVADNMVEILSRGAMAPQLSSMDIYDNIPDNVKEVLYDKTTVPEWQDVFDENQGLREYIIRERTTKESCMGVNCPILRRGGRIGNQRIMRFRNGGIIPNFIRDVAGVFGIHD